MSRFSAKECPQHLLGKVRSDDLKQAFKGMPCDLRIASFIPGLSCAPRSTVIPAHAGGLGKGTSTKVSDHFMVAACLTCHDLLDGRHEGWKYLADHYPAAVLDRVLTGVAATQIRLIMMGHIIIPKSEFIQ